MKKIMLVLFTVIICAGLFPGAVRSGGKGGDCFGDADCGTGRTCEDGVCVKDKDFNPNSGDDTGEPCDNDGDCIGSGKCKKNTFDEGRCTGE